MKYLGTLFTLVLIGGIGAALWWSDKRDAEVVDDIVDNRPTGVFDGRLLSEAERISILHDRQQPRVELQRDPSLRWWVEEPLRDVANRGRLGGLISVYDAQQMQLIPAYEADEVTEELLEQTGLGEPRAALSARFSDGAEFEIEIGTEGLFGDDVWVRRDGQIYRGSEALWTALQGNADDWREPFVFANEEGNAQALRMTRRTIGGDADLEEVLFTRRGEGRWDLQKPARLRIDQEKARTYVSTLLSLQVGRFLSGRPTEGLSPLDPEAPPDMIIEVRGSLGDERVELLSLGNSIVGHAVSRRLWFRVDSADWQRAVATPVSTLRSQLVFEFGPGEVRRVVLTPPADAAPGEYEVVELLRDGPRGELQLVRPVQGAVEPTAAAELLSALRSMIVLRFVSNDVEDFTPFGLEEGAAWSVELQRRRGQPGATFLLGDTAGDGKTVYLRRADEAHVVAVPRDRVENLSRPWTDWVDQQIYRLPGAQVVREVVLERGADQARELRFVAGAGGMWRAAGSETVDARLVETIERLYDLRARQVADASVTIPDGRAADFALELIGPTERALVRLEFHDGLGKPDAGALWARRPDRPELCYLVGPLDADALRGLAAR